jgi:hypothetical protein
VNHVEQTGNRLSSSKRKRKTPKPKVKDFEMKERPVIARGLPKEGDVIGTLLKMNPLLGTK